MDAIAGELMGWGLL